jgi:hypothetical protein
MKSSLYKLKSTIFTSPTDLPAVEEGNSTIITNCTNCGATLSHTKRKNRKLSGLCQKCWHILENQRNKNAIPAVPGQPYMSVLKPGNHVGEESAVRVFVNGKHKVRKYIWAECPICKKQRWLCKEASAERVYCRCRKCARATRASELPLDKRKKSFDHGYLKIALPINHWCIPMTNAITGQIPVHRLIMAEHLRRLLLPTEIVHHINGNKTDNRVENLILVNQDKHKTNYGDGYRQGYIDGIKANQNLDTAIIKKQNTEILHNLKLLQLRFKLADGTIL